MITHLLNRWGKPYCGTPFQGSPKVRFGQWHTVRQCKRCERCRLREIKENNLQWGGNDNG